MATYAPGRFAVREIESVGHDLWKGQVECAFEESLSGTGVAQVLRVTVRFTYEADGSAKGLLEAAKAKAVEALSDAAKHLQQHSAADLIDSAFEANRPMTPDELEAEIAKGWVTQEAGG